MPTVEITKEEKDLIYNWMESLDEFPEASEVYWEVIGGEDSEQVELTDEQALILADGLYGLVDILVDDEEGDWRYQTPYTKYDYSRSNMIKELAKRIEKSMNKKTASTELDELFNQAEDIALEEVRYSIGVLKERWGGTKTSVDYRKINIGDGGVSGSCVAQVDLSQLPYVPSEEVDDIVSFEIEVYLFMPEKSVSDREPPKSRCVVQGLIRFRHPGMMMFVGEGLEWKGKEQEFEFENLQEFESGLNFALEMIENELT